MEVGIIGEQLQTERMQNGHRKLIRDLKVQIGDATLVIPKGTETDFSSIPHPVRMFLRWSRVDVAGVVHDWLYHCGEISRSEADTIWRLVALSGNHHANFLQAWGGWVLLRAFGWYAWQQCRAEDHKLKSC